MTQKAFKLTVNNIVEEPWHYDDIIVYAETHGEAKSKGLSEFSCAEIEDYKAYDGKRYIEYTDIKARRVKELDKILYEGNYITVKEVKQKEWVKERDDRALKLFEDHPNEIAVVWANCYGAYWGANRSGYNSTLELAGKYTTKEAYEIVKGNDYSRGEEVRLLSVVDYNKEIDRKVQELQIKIEKYKKCKL